MNLLHVRGLCVCWGIEKIYIFLLHRLPSFIEGWTFNFLEIFYDSYQFFEFYWAIKSYKELKIKVSQIQIKLKSRASIKSNCHKSTKSIIELKSLLVVLASILLWKEACKFFIPKDFPRMTSPYINSFTFYSLVYQWIPEQSH